MPPEVFHQEIFDDRPGKERQGKKGKWRTREGGKLKTDKKKYENEQRIFFFFFFFLLFTFLKQLKFVWSTKMEIFSRKKPLLLVGKNREK